MFATSPFPQAIPMVQWSLLPQFLLQQYDTAVQSFFRIIDQLFPVSDEFVCNRSALPLDLDDPNQPTLPEVAETVSKVIHPTIPETTEVESDETSLEQLSIPELEVLFKEKVGYDPKMRFHEAARWGDRKELLIRGIENPQQGSTDVTTYDKEYEKIGDPHSGV